MHCIIVFYTQELGTGSDDAGILVGHLFSLGLLKPATASLLILDSSWQQMYCFVLLNGMAHTGYINLPKTSCL